MRVVVTVEGRFERTPDQTVWTQTKHDYRFWSTYLSAFDRVHAVARVLDVPTPSKGAVPVGGPGVTIGVVPYYLGPYQFFWRQREIGQAIRGSANGSDAVILRAPSPIGSLLANARDRRGWSYAMEVVGDPYDALAPRAVRHPLRPLLRRWLARGLRRQCHAAIGVLYVTQHALQQRYPARTDAVTASASDVDLIPEAYVTAPRTSEQFQRARTLVSVGSLEQPYKGIDTLISALPRLNSNGEPVRLIHVGEGRYRPELQQLAQKLDVADRVVFTGTLPSGAAVRQQLDEADLFVMPSRTEGLPRALIEAMARGLPAIGTAVGGIPELLSPEFIVRPDDPARLATEIERLLAQPERMAAASARNLDRAKDFSAENQVARRIAYYRAVAEATAAKQTGRGSL